MTISAKDIWPDADLTSLCTSYYSYDDPGTGKVVTLSALEILNEYLPRWIVYMTRAGHDPYSSAITDCINDWIVENYAWDHTGNRGD